MTVTAAVVLTMVSCKADIRMSFILALVPSLVQISGFTLGVWREWQLLGGDIWIEFPF